MENNILGNRGGTNNRHTKFYQLKINLVNKYIDELDDGIVLVSDIENKINMSRNDILDILITIIHTHKRQDLFKYRVGAKLKFRKETKIKLCKHCKKQIFVTGYCSVICAKKGIKLKGETTMHQDKRMKEDKTKDPEKEKPKAPTQKKL